MKVSKILNMIQKDGWFLVATRGSHRQFKHLVKHGRVTVPGTVNLFSEFRARLATALDCAALHRGYGWCKRCSP